METMTPRRREGLVVFDDKVSTPTNEKSNPSQNETVNTSPECTKRRGRGRPPFLTLTTPSLA